MSHFTKCDTKITNLNHLKQALENLNKKYTTGEVRGYRGQKITADLSINLGKYDVGVVKNANGCYSFVADWWGVETTTGNYQQEVIEEIQQEYAYVCITNACEEMGYQIEEKKVAADGKISMTAGKWTEK